MAGRIGAEHGLPSGWYVDDHAGEPEGHRLRDLRLAAGLSMGDAARALDVPVVQVSEIEALRREPTELEREALLAVYAAARLAPGVAKGLRALIGTSVGTGARTVEVPEEPRVEDVPSDGELVDAFVADTMDGNARIRLCAKPPKPGAACRHDEARLARVGVRACQWCARTMPEGLADG